MFKPDKPIELSKEDILGRGSFSKALAEAILLIKDKNNIVIGLYGEWGTGKTSVINMALEHVTEMSVVKPSEEKPIVVRFNPWNFSDQNQLITQFFQHLSSMLKRKDFSEEAKEIGTKLDAYSKFFEPLTLVPEFRRVPGTRT